MLAEVGAAVVGAEVGGDGECQSFCSIDDIVGVKLAINLTMKVVAA